MQTGNNMYVCMYVKVGKVLTARENPGGKTPVFPGWAILPEMAVLGNISPILKFS